jgi:sugar diacid utilization regulator
MERTKEFVEKQYEDQVLTETEQFEIDDHHVLITPIIIQNETYGYLSIYQKGTKFGDAEIDFLERAVSVCAVKMLNERTAIQTEEKMKGDLLEELFKGETDPSNIIKRFSYFGYNIKQPQYVLVVDFPSKNLFSNSGKSVKNEQKLLNAFFNREEIHYVTTFVKLEKYNKEVILIPNEYLEKKKTTIKQFAQQCYKVMQKANEKSEVFIGVSGLCTDVEQYSRNFQEAKKAIEIAKSKYRLRKEDYIGVVHADDLGHIMILLDARKPEGLLEYAHRYLQSLKEYDEKNSSELLKTLYYYIENECNLHKTARDMDVSISGMRYRIQRIEELINVNLSKASSKFEIQLSLQTYLAFNLL